MRIENRRSGQESQLAGTTAPSHVERPEPHAVNAGHRKGADTETARFARNDPKPPEANSRSDTKQRAPLQLYGARAQHTSGRQTTR